MTHYQFYIGRQAIYDAHQQVVAYELLYRQRNTTEAGVVDGDQATSQVIVNSLWEMGLARLVGRHRAFINITRNFVVSGDLLLPPSDQLVLEILEDIAADGAVVSAVQKLKQRGYIIALDDFVYHDDLRPLVELADIVKLDVQAVSGDLEEQVARLRRYPVQLLAEKVETPEMFDRCRALSFDYYQGYFLCHPRILKGRRLPANRVNAMRMMTRLQTPELDVRGLEQVISQDVSISYKLLKYINSAAFALKSKIDSIRHAIVYLGDKEIRRWATLIAIAGIDDKPDELMTVSLIRAKMCELLATVTETGNRDSAFLVGLFSTLDAMMDQPLAYLLRSLPLAPEIHEALVENKGPYAELLHHALAYERGDWDRVETVGSAGAAALPASYLQSLDWAETTMRELRAAAN